jgi:hypothetical protein
MRRDGRLADANLVCVRRIAGRDVANQDLLAAADGLARRGVRHSRFVGSELVVGWAGASEDDPR